MTAPWSRGLVATGLAAAFGALVAARYLSDTGGDPRLPFVFASFVVFVAVQSVLIALRVAEPVRVLYGYLATPYFANRAVAEVWLGDPGEPGAGTFAPLLLGDGLLLVGLVRSRNRFPIVGLMMLAALAAPVAAALWVSGFSAGAFVYQYLGIVRIALVAYFVFVTVEERSGAFTPIAIVTHLGFIFAVLGALSGGVALSTDTRFGVPGWGANVYANALCIVGLLCAWNAMQHRRPLLWVFAAAIFVGIVGSETRVALSVFALGLVGMVLFRLLGRRWRIVSALVVIVGAGLVVAMPGRAVGALATINPRLGSIGGGAVASTANVVEVGEAVLRESSVRSRLALWRGSVDMFVASPLVGLGWGQWNWQKAAYGVEFDVLLDPHNGYLWLLSEGGIVALLTALIVAVGVARRLSASAFAATLPLIAVFEIVNANLQKGLFGVLAATLVGAALAVSRRSRRGRAGGGAR